MTVCLIGMLLSIIARPLSPAAGVVVKKVATAFVTGAAFASLDAGLNSISSKPQPPTTPTPKVDYNGTGHTDIMIVIVLTTGASVVIVFIILLGISVLRALNAKQNASNNE